MDNNPVTAAIFETLRIAHAPETDRAHYLALMEVARNGVEELEQECVRLNEWKRQALAVSSQCDIQAVGTLLKVPLGRPIYPAIEPGIRDLLAKLKAALPYLDQVADEGPSPIGEKSDELKAFIAEIENLTHQH